MPITTVDGIVAALGGALGSKCQPQVINKASLANAAAAQWFSLWRATGVPSQGAIPAATGVCTSALAGALPFSNPTGGDLAYLARAALAAGNAGTEVHVHDRLLQSLPLNGTLTSAQAVNLDATVAPLNARRGAANFSELQWWLEWYADTGATPVTATVNVTYDDASTGNVAIALAATTRASRLIPILTAVAGRQIRGVNTVTLSATTGAAGSFSVTCTRAMSSVACVQANRADPADWALLGFPQVPSDACLMLLLLCNTATTGAVYGTLTVVQG